MSDTEAMDISPAGSTRGGSEIPGIDKVPDIGNNHTVALKPVTELAPSPEEISSDMKDDGPIPQLKPGVRPRDDLPGQADPNERPLKRARTLDSQVQ